MKNSLLVSFISTLAFSFGLVGASGTISVKRGLQVPINDAMGIASNYIVCRKQTIRKADTSYNKREAYAAVGQAMMYMKQGNHAVVGCESIKVCSRYPKNFADSRINFKIRGPYMAFPLLSNGQIFTGGRLPVSDLVIFDHGGEVAGIVYASMNGYFKCLVDDNFVPRPQTLGAKLKYKFQYHTGRLPYAQ